MRPNFEVKGFICAAVILLGLPLALGSARAGNADTLNLRTTGRATDSVAATLNFHEAQRLYLAGDLDGAMSKALLALQEDPQIPGLGQLYQQLVQEQQRLKQVNLGNVGGQELSARPTPSRSRTSPGAWGRVWEALYGLRDNSEAHWGELEGKVDTQAQEQQVMAEDLVRLQDSVTRVQQNDTHWLFWVLLILLALLLVLLALVGVLMRVRKSLADLRLEFETRKLWTSRRLSSHAKTSDD